MISKQNGGDFAKRGCCFWLAIKALYMLVYNNRYSASNLFSFTSHGESMVKLDVELIKGIGLLRCYLLC